MAEPRNSVSTEPITEELEPDLEDMLMAKAIVYHKAFGVGFRDEAEMTRAHEKAVEDLQTLVRALTLSPNIEGETHVNRQQPANQTANAPALGQRLGDGEAPWIANPLLQTPWLGPISKLLMQAVQYTVYKDLCERQAAELAELHALVNHLELPRELAECYKKFGRYSLEVRGLREQTAEHVKMEAQWKAKSKQQAEEAEELRKIIHMRHDELGIELFGYQERIGRHKLEIARLEEELRDQTDQKEKDQTKISNQTKQLKSLTELYKNAKKRKLGD